jgi:hypothetical protein
MPCPTGWLASGKQAKLAAAAVETLNRMLPH